MCFRIKTYENVYCHWDACDNVYCLWAACDSVGCLYKIVGNVCLGLSVREAIG